MSRRTPHGIIFLVSCGLLSSGLALSSGCTSRGLVGGTCGSDQVVFQGSCLDQCPDGLTLCNGVCVDITDDPNNCGECGLACGGGEVCFESMCTSTPGCDPPFETNDCNDCCEGQTPVCAPVGSEYECVISCEPPLEECDGVCVDTDNDPNNCGGCGVVCPGQTYCQDGSCIGDPFGHIVLMCINYEETVQSTPSQWLLGNASFLPPTASVRVLAFNGFTPTALASQVERTLAWAGAAQGRSYTLSTESDPDQIPEALVRTRFDTFLVYDQPDAATGVMATLGANWKDAIDAFVEAGGTTVVLSGGDSEMAAFMTAAELLVVTGEVDVSGQTLHNRALTDAVGVNVLTPFRAMFRSCTFTTPAVPSETMSFVITPNPPTQPLGAPVVVHRILMTP